MMVEVEVQRTQFCIKNSFEVHQYRGSSAEEEEHVVLHRYYEGGLSEEEEQFFISLVEINESNERVSSFGVINKRSVGSFEELEMRTGIIVGRNFSDVHDYDRRYVREREGGVEYLDVNDYISQSFVAFLEMVDVIFVKMIRNETEEVEELDEERYVKVLLDVIYNRDEVVNIRRIPKNHISDYRQLHRLIGLAIGQYDPNDRIVIHDCLLRFRNSSDVRICHEGQLWESFIDGLRVVYVEGWFAS